MNIHIVPLFDFFIHVISLMTTDFKGTFVITHDSSITVHVSHTLFI